MKSSVRGSLRSEKKVKYSLIKFNESQSLMCNQQKMEKRSREKGTKKN